MKVTIYSNAKSRLLSNHLAGRLDDGSDGFYVSFASGAVFT